MARPIFALGILIVGGLISAAVDGKSQDLSEKTCQIEITVGSTNASLQIVETTFAHYISTQQKDSVVDLGVTMNVKIAWCLPKLHNFKHADLVVSMFHPR